MRVLALVTDSFGASGGIAQYNRDLFRALSACDSSPEIYILSRNGNPGRGTGQEAVVGETRRNNRWLYTVTALTRAVQFRPQVVFCGHIYMAPLAALVCRLSGARLWIQIHGIESWNPPGPATRRAVEAADLVTSVSRYTRRRLLEWSRLAPERLRIIPNTVDEQFTPGSKPENLVHRLGLSGRRVMLTVGRISSSERYKGHDRLIEALAGLGGNYSDVVYLVVGEGEDRTRLEQLAATSGLSERVIFAGHVPDEDLPQWYRLADCFVMPSTGEGFGIVYLQALASGIPVLAFNAGGSPDPLRDGSWGLLQEPGDLAPALEQILDRVGTTRVERDRLLEVFGSGSFRQMVGRAVRRLSGAVA